MMGFYQIWLSGIVGHVQRHRTLYIVVVLAILAGILLAKCDPRDSSIQSHESKAQQAEAEALNREGRADAASDQADAIELQRVEQAKRVEEARQRRASGRVSLAQKRKDYDEAQHGTSSIDRSGSLSERELRILAKLDQLYPGIGAIRSRTFDFKD